MEEKKELRKYGKLCFFCNNPFVPPLYNVKKGFGKYCSRLCYSADRKGKMPVNTNGLILGRGWNKGNGFSLKERMARRRETVAKSNKKRSLTIRKWHVLHKDRVASFKSKYAQSKKGKIAARLSAQRRLAREKNLKKKMNWEYWEWLCEKLGYTCQGCGEKFDLFTLTIDHVLPIIRGGDNDEWNIQPLCRSCNGKKQGRLMWVDNVQIDLAYGDWLLEQRGEHV